MNPTLSWGKSFSKKTFPTEIFWFFLPIYSQEFDCGGWERKFQASLLFSFWFFLKKYCFQQYTSIRLLLCRLLGNVSKMNDPWNVAANDYNGHKSLSGNIYNLGYILVLFCGWLLGVVCVSQNVEPLSKEQCFLVWMLGSCRNLLCCWFFLFLCGLSSAVLFFASFLLVYCFSYPLGRLPHGLQILQLVSC